MSKVSPVIFTFSSVSAKLHLFYRIDKDFLEMQEIFLRFAYPIFFFLHIPRRTVCLPESAGLSDLLCIDTVFPTVAIQSSMVSLQELEGTRKFATRSKKHAETLLEGWNSIANKQAKNNTLNIQRELIGRS